MSHSIQNLQTVLNQAMANRPKVAGFPYLAEYLRQAGVKSNTWELPSCQCLYAFEDIVIVNQGVPLITGMSEIPNFDKSALIKALRTDQAGQSTFPEFLNAAWQAGVITYHVDFAKRTVTYYGAKQESYEESYPLVELEKV